MDAEDRGWLLFVAAMACLLPAVVLGLSRSGTPIWQPALLALLPGGALALLYGVLVKRRSARWIGLFAEEPDRVGSIIAAGGLAGSASGCTRSAARGRCAS